jgi:hypothetical protein
MITCAKDHSDPPLTQGLDGGCSWLELEEAQVFATTALHAKLAGARAPSSPKRESCQNGRCTSQRGMPSPRRAGPRAERRQRGLELPGCACDGTGGGLGIVEHCQHCPVVLVMTRRLLCLPSPPPDSFLPRPPSPSPSAQSARRRRCTGWRSTTRRASACTTSTRSRASPSGRPPRSPTYDTSASRSKTPVPENAHPQRSPKARLRDEVLWEPPLVIHDSLCSHGPYECAANPVCPCLIIPHHRSTRAGTKANYSIGVLGRSGTLYKGGSTKDNPQPAPAPAPTPDTDTPAGTSSEALMAAAFNIAPPVTPKASAPGPAEEKPSKPGMGLFRPPSIVIPASQARQVTTGGNVGVQKVLGMFLQGGRTPQAALALSPTAVQFLSGRTPTAERAAEIRRGLK